MHWLFLHLHSHSRSRERDLRVAEESATRSYKWPRDDTTHWSLRKERFLPFLHTQVTRNFVSEKRMKRSRRRGRRRRMFERSLFMLMKKRSPEHLNFFISEKKRQRKEEESQEEEEEEEEEERRRIKARSVLTSARHLIWLNIEMLSRGSRIKLIQEAGKSVTCLTIQITLEWSVFAA